MAGVDFVLVLQVVAFLCAIWLGGRLFKVCHQPAILGYLLVGIVMGPQLLDMVPYASDGTQPRLRYGPASVRQQRTTGVPIEAHRPLSPTARSTHVVLVPPGSLSAARRPPAPARCACAPTQAHCVPLRNRHQALATRGSTGGSRRQI